MFRLQLCFCSSVFNVHVLGVIISPITSLVTITIHSHFHTKPSLATQFRICYVTVSLIEISLRNIALFIPMA